jgi:hypothetical protein
LQLWLNCELTALLLLLFLLLLPLSSLSSSPEWELPESTEEFATKNEPRRLKNEAAAAVASLKKEAVATTTRVKKAEAAAAKEATLRLGFRAKLAFFHPETNAFIRNELSKHGASEQAAELRRPPPLGLR